MKIVASIYEWCQNKLKNEDNIIPNIYLWIPTCQNLILGLNTYFGMPHKNQ